VTINSGRATEQAVYVFANHAQCLLNLTPLRPHFPQQDMPFSTGLVIRDHGFFMCPDQRFVNIAQHIADANTAFS